MCGIVGSVGIPIDSYRSYLLLTSLLAKTQRRGSHATGHFIVDSANKTDFFKAGIPSSIYVSLPHWTNIQNVEHKAFIGHARYTTNGSSKNNNNNHPFVSPSGNVGLIHNGTIYQYYKYRNKYTLDGYCDSEILLHMILQKNNILLGIKDIYTQLGATGDFACLLIYRNPDTNTTKLYFFRDPGRPGRFIDARDILGQVFFCSTTDIWRDAIYEHPDYDKLRHLRIDIIPAYQIWEVDAETLNIRRHNIIQPSRPKSKIPARLQPLLSLQKRSGQCVTSGNCFGDSIFAGKLDGCPAGQPTGWAGYLDIDRL